MKILKVEHTRPNARRESKTVVTLQYDLLADGDATPEKDAELVRLVRRAIESVKFRSGAARSVCHRYAPTRTKS